MTAQIVYLACRSTAVSGSVKENIMNYSIRNATPDDRSEIDALLPRLADFDVPPYRVTEHLWHGDRDLIRQWANGERTDVNVAVATVDNTVVGVAAISERKELLSGEPSAHLEILAIKQDVEGHGIGSSLMQRVNAMAKNSGAKSISLHVFSNNTKARALYERHGYFGELMRYYKPVT